jgi:hypothetical protein
MKDEPLTQFDPATGAREPSSLGHQPSHEDIAVLAQHIYQEEGCPFGRAEAHWHEAERRLRQQAAGIDPRPVAAVAANEADRLYSPGT